MSGFIMQYYDGQEKRDYSALCTKDSYEFIVRK